MNDPQLVRSCDDIIRSPEDKRTYRCLQLMNGLKIALVQDSEAEKVAVSMDVHIGIQQTFSLYDYVVY